MFTSHRTYFIKRTPFVEKPLVIGSRRWLKAMLHKETSRIVRARDKRCVILGCGSRFKLECGHFYSRVYLHIAFDLRNCNAQCHFHNQLHIRNPFPYLEYMAQRWGQAVLDELNFLRSVRTKVTDDQLKETLALYRSM
jgi:hypothetical protein